MFKKIYTNLKPFLFYDISVMASWFIFYITILIFRNYTDAPVFDVLGLILFCLFLSAFFIKLGYSEKIKDISVGMILFEIKLLAYAVWYMLEMVNSIELPSSFSIMAFGNIIYGDFKPITRLISDVNYNVLVCIPDLLLSLALPVFLFGIGYLIKKKPRNCPRFN